MLYWLLLAAIAYLVVEIAVEAMTMMVKLAAKELRHRYTRQNQTAERCSYCLLPVCAEHGKPVQPWFTCRVVTACTPCQAKLEEIAQQEEQCLPWTAAFTPSYE